MAKPLVQFPHNYNYVSRAVMYQWFNKHLKLGLAEPIVEERLPAAVDRRDDGLGRRASAPPAGDDYERDLLAGMTADSDGKLAALTPHDSQSSSQYRQIVGGAIEVIIGRGLPPAGSVTMVQQKSSDRGGWLESAGLVRYAAENEELPVVLLQPKQPNGRAVIWLSDEGKAGIYRADGQPIPEVVKLLSAGATVVAPDLIYQGEFLADGKPLAQVRRVKNPREYLGYTLGYNRALVAQRAADVLSLVSWLALRIAAARGRGDSRRERDGPLGRRRLGAGPRRRRPGGDRHGRLSLRQPEIGVGREPASRRGQVWGPARHVEPRGSHQAAAGGRRE